MYVLIHHSEIILKGKNRRFFEKKLIDNIKCLFEDVKVLKDLGGIICEINALREEISGKLKKVFGIKYFAFVEIIDREKLFETIEEIIKNLKVKTLAPITKRADKTFPLKSPEINAKIGEIANKYGIKIDYKNAEQKIFIEITSKAYIYAEKIQAHGGLPVGSSGNVLCLLSGGIDSPVAAWLAMRRGCKVDFLHFHTFQENKQVLGTKIENLVKKLDEYQGRSRLFLIPYHIYQFESLNNNERIDLVLFKNFILRIAQEVVLKENYKAIITGDNLGQVASQTLQNLQSTSYGVNALILRPVITYTKDEIIKLSQEIGVYEESIKEYKDCCSILSKRPLTRASIEQVETALQKVDINKIIKESLEKMEVFNFKK